MAELTKLESKLAEVLEQTLQGSLRLAGTEDPGALAA